MKNDFLKLLACILILSFSSCKKEEKAEYKGVAQPSDSSFGGAPISEGTPLTVTVDITKLKSVAGDPTDATALAALKEQRKKIIEKAVADMVYVDGGSFLMGATEEQGADVHLYEKNVHKVTLSSYYISKFQVTQELYLIVMGGSNQGTYKETNNLQIPIDNRLYTEMQTFVTNLNTITGLKFSLPTEAQWEFAARGGRKRTNTKYAGSNNLDEVAWYWDNSLRLPQGQTSSVRWPQSVGLKKPNELGIYDMGGNLAEVCSDWYAPYELEDQVDPTGPASLPTTTLQKRVCRGGAFITFGDPCRVSARSACLTANRFNYIGFRLVHPKK